MLSTLLPIRDRRERVVGYSVSSCPADDGGAGESDANARRTLESIPTLTRLAGRSLIVPVTPALLREGAVTRFASTDAVWLLATESLEDAETRRAVERLMGSGLHFALQGFPDGAPLPAMLVGSTIVLDAMRTPPPLLDSRARLLVEAGLRPLVRNVDDRFTRRRMLEAGVPMTCGRLLARGATTIGDRAAEEAALRALRQLAIHADGRPADAAFDRYVHDDPHLGAALMRALGSATLGARGPRSVGHALNLLGREAVMDHLLAVAARLLAGAAGDPELALIALRRARLLEGLGSTVKGASHPRARALAGLLSVAEFALGAPSSHLVEQLELPPVLVDAVGDRALPLGKLVDIVDAMEFGWWDDLRSRCAQLGITPLAVSEAWMEAYNVGQRQQRQA